MAIKGPIQDSLAIYETGTGSAPAGTSKRFPTALQCTDSPRGGSQRSILDGVRAKEEAEVAELPALTAERTECHEVVRAARDALRQLRSDLKAAEDAWFQNERLLRSQQRDEQQKVWEAGQAERKERDQQRKEWERDNAPEPFEKDVTACQQVRRRSLSLSVYVARCLVSSMCVRVCVAASSSS